MHKQFILNIVEKLCLNKALFREPGPLSDEKAIRRRAQQTLHVLRLWL